TGALPKDGGRIANTSQTASISGVLSASKLYCITTSATSGEPRAISEATLWGMNVTVGGNTITADWLHSMAGARCPTDATPFSSGSSFFTNLRVNGRTIALQKTPNRKIELPNGYIVVNEQTSFVTPWHAGRTVIGLRIVITRNGSADVVLARSQTHIDCP
ncbi:MAG: choice-of-anchor P family protein, partial [Gemmatimonadota bacterium]